MSLAFVFPGQGSHSVGMMQAFVDQGIVRDTFAQASDALKQDLWALIELGPAESLNQTENTQPVMLAAGVAIYRLWYASAKNYPIVLAGHSLGEYSALVAAGALDFAAAVQTVRLRARLMQEAVPAGVGAMAAILGLDDAQVEAACAQAAQGETVEAANYNSPAQVVIAGHKAAVERAVDVAKSKGAKRAVLLAVSVPSHCSLLREAADKFGSQLAKVRIEAPKIPVIQNATLIAPTTADEVRSALAQQLYRPVRWVDTVRRLAERGAKTIVECGPGKVLAGLNKRIDPSLVSIAITDMKSLDDALRAEG